jgi:hypothetical protein
LVERLNGIEEVRGSIPLGSKVLNGNINIENPMLPSTAAPFTAFVDLKLGDRRDGDWRQMKFASLGALPSRLSDAMH